MGVGRKLGGKLGKWEKWEENWEGDWDIDWGRTGTRPKYSRGGTKVIDKSGEQSVVVCGVR